MKSIDNFDPTIGVKFSTYAVPMIIGEVRRYLRDNSAYRIPRSLRDTAYQAIKSKEKLSRKLVHDPSLAEISKDCGIPETIYYTHLMQSRHRFPSLILYILTVVIHFM